MYTVSEKQYHESFVDIGYKIKNDYRKSSHSLNMHIKTLSKLFQQTSPNQKSRWKPDIILHTNTSSSIRKFEV